jgi:hypothetical protein
LPNQQVVANGIANGILIKSIDYENGIAEISRPINHRDEPFQICILLDPGGVVKPYMTRWFGDLVSLSPKILKTSNPNANYNNNNFNSNQK